MNIDILEEKAKVAIEVEELQIKINRNKELQITLVQDLVKKVGQLELLAKFELTAGVLNENNSLIGEDENE